MVIRPVVSGALRAPAVRSSWFAAWRGAAAIVALGAVLVAQAETPVSPPAVPPTPTTTPTGAAESPAAATPAAATPAPVGTSGPALAANLTFGRCVVDQVPLRCWPGAVAQPPVFEDTLVKDQVVALGRVENGFRAIVVPLGPVGYVSRKFAEPTAEGRLKTKGAKVSFRYRPKSGEPPVAQLADGTELHVIAEQDEWFKVRAPGVEAWVAETDVQPGDASDPALAKGYAEWQQRQQAELQVRLDQIAAAAARAAQDKIDLEAVRTVEAAFLAEQKKAVQEQNYAGMQQALEGLLPTLAADSAARGEIGRLQQRIGKQQWVINAMALRDAQPPASDAPVPVQTKDNLDRFQSIGWLRSERRLGGPVTYYLEKGGQQLCLLACNSGRYDLALFVGREVGVIGPRRRPKNDSLSVLDVERLEVLGTLQP